MKKIMIFAIVLAVACSAAEAKKKKKEPNEPNATIKMHEPNQAAIATSKNEQIAAKDANTPGMKHPRETYQQEMVERHQARMAELNELRTTAQSERCTQTLAQIDKLIARENQLYQEREKLMKEHQSK